MLLGGGHGGAVGVGRRLCSRLRCGPRQGHCYQCPRDKYLRGAVHTGEACHARRDEQWDDRAVERKRFALPAEPHGDDHRRGRKGGSGGKSDGTERQEYVEGRSVSSVERLPGGVGPDQRDLGLRSVADCATEQ